MMKNKKTALFVIIVVVADEQSEKKEYEMCNAMCKYSAENENKVRFLQRKG